MTVRKGMSGLPLGGSEALFLDIAEVPVPLSLQRKACLDTASSVQFSDSFG